MPPSNYIVVDYLSLFYDINLILGLNLSALNKFSINDTPNDLLEDY